jgi:hypothetical protein
MEAQNTLITRLTIEGDTEVKQALEAVAGRLKEFKTAIRKTDVGHGGFITIEEGAKASGVSVAVLTKELKKMNMEIATIDGQKRLAFNKLTGEIQPLGKALEKASMNSKRFKMEWLSVMFFSQMATRQLTRVMTSSIQTFMKIAGEGNRTNQALATMGAQFEFIRFTIGRVIGEALEPMLPAIMAFTETIVNFIQEHPEEVVFALASAFVLFATATVVSNLQLLGGALSSIISGIGNLDVSKLTSLTSLSKLANIGAISLVVKGLVDASNGDWATAVADLLGAGGLAVLKSSPKLGAGLLGISAAILLTEIATDSEFSIMNFIQALASAGIAGAMVGGPWGAAIAIGIVLLITGIKFASDAAKKAQREWDSVGLGNKEITPKGSSGTRQFSGEVDPNSPFWSWQEGNMSLPATIDITKINTENIDVTGLNTSLSEGISVKFDSKNIVLPENFTIPGLTDIPKKTEDSRSAWQKFTDFVGGTTTKLIDWISGQKGLGFYIGGDTQGSYPLVYAANLAIVGFENLSKAGVISMDAIILKADAVGLKIAMLGMMIGSNEMVDGKMPMVFALNIAQTKWISMADVSVAQVDRIIQKLNAIPREIITIHRIIEKTERSGSSSSLITPTQRNK